MYVQFLEIMPLQFRLTKPIFACHCSISIFIYNKLLENTDLGLLKLVSIIFYEIIIFSPNDSPSKTIKNVFYFIEKPLFVLEIFKFLKFFPFLSTVSRFKRTNGTGVIYDVMNWPA